MTHRSGSALFSSVASTLLFVGSAACSETGTGESPVIPIPGGSGGSAIMAGAGGAGTVAAGSGGRIAPGAGVSGLSGAIAGGSGKAGAAGANDDTDGGVIAGAGGTSGSSGVGGASGSGAAPSDDGLGSQPAFEPTGVPIMAPDKTWTWVPFADSKCRGGSEAGISVSLNPASKRTMIYLEGGGACFDSQTCGANPSSVGSRQPGANGVFNRTRAENPVRDWNFVYVPYCTGDVHMGAATNVTVAGVTGQQQFVGRLNLTAFLQRLVPTFADAEQVLLTGVSAGGFGATSNAAFVQWAFGDVPVAMIDDSGPTFSSDFLPSCLTKKYAQTWGLAKSILADCGSACSADADYSVQFLEYSAKRSKDRFNGLIEADGDGTIRAFLGIGTNNGADDCQGNLLLTPMAASDFLAGLLDYRKRVQQYPGFSTFYPTSTSHTWLGGEAFYTITAGNTKLVDWFKAILEGKPALHAGH